MSKKVSGLLYTIARGVGKLAGTVNDLETIATLNPAKIGKRIARKTVGKATNALTQAINRKIR